MAVAFDNGNNFAPSGDSLRNKIYFCRKSAHFYKTKGATTDGMILKLDRVDEIIACLE